MQLVPTVLILTIALNASAQGFITDYTAFLQSVPANRCSECIERGNHLLKTTRHPNILYKMAECYCQADSVEQSLQLLQELAEKGLPYNIAENKKPEKITANNTFKSLRATQKATDKKDPVKMMTLLIFKLCKPGKY